MANEKSCATQSDLVHPLPATWKHFERAPLLCTEVRRLRGASPFVALHQSWIAGPGVALGEAFAHGRSLPLMPSGVLLWISMTRVSGASGTP